MHEFADVEFHIYVLLAQMAGVRPNVANAIFSGVKADGAMDLIRRIIQSYRTVPAELQAEIDYVFPQLKAINDVRNFVVHYGGHDYDGQGRVASNFTKALSPEKVRAFTVDPKTLMAMTVDLAKIRIHLRVLLIPTKRLRRKAHQDRKPSALTAAWLYTPPQQAQKLGKSLLHRMRLGAPKSPPRQRGASRA
jgi:hypothetical protein